LLTDLGLYQDNKITVAALILLGKDTSLQRFLPFSDIRYGYKERMHDIRNQDMAIFAEGYLLYYDKLLNKINTRNLDINIPVGMQLISRKMFEEETIREAVNNAVIHRDYLTNESTFITQSSSKIVLKSPGGFLEGVNPDNIIDQTKTRNKLIANVLFKCGFVEQFGNGINLIYKNQLTAGKNLPSFSDSDDNHVVIDIDGTVQDIEFAQYIFKIAFEKNRELSDYELITLNNIKNNKKIKSSDITEALLSLELIEKLSPQRYILSRKYYASTNNKAAFTLKVGINKEERKMLILKHLEHYKKGVMSEFSQLMKDISTDTIYGYLCELRDMGKIKFVGNRQITKGKNKGFWELV
jgi:ATP-dependent DNA helicase RecG